MTSNALFFKHVTISIVQQSFRTNSYEWEKSVTNFDLIPCTSFSSLAISLLKYGIFLLFPRRKQPPSV